MAENEWEQRFRWLEQEQRKHRAQVVTLQDRVVHLEGQIRALQEQLRGLSDEMGRWAGVQARVQALEETLQQVRSEFARQHEVLQVQMQERWQALQQELRSHVAQLQGEVNELREALKALSALEHRLARREEAEDQLARRIDRVDAALQELERLLEERTQVMRLLQEHQERGTRRLLEVQNDLTTLRKRLEELAGAQSVLGQSLQKMQARLQELRQLEEERRKEQREFLEKVNREQAERERQWKAWEARFQSLEDMASRLEAQMQAMDAFRRELNRAKDRLEDMLERMERRMHEMAEMQRLAQEQFRQEWVTFKADEQKRWTAFQLTYEEQQQEVLRRLDQHQQTMQQHEDQLTQLQDGLAMVQEQIHKHLTSLAELVHAWVDEYERLFRALQI